MEWEGVMKSFQLTREEISELAGKFPTPFMVASLEKVEENYRYLRKHLSRAGIYYAMKANPAEKILKTVERLGSSFDVASAGEMKMLHDIGVDSSRMIYANPVKDFAGLAMAREIGLRRFTFDDLTEIPKMAEYVPGADVLVRISVRNNKALVDLNTKFGARPQDAMMLLQEARKAGLRPVGICFHVGSQSLSTAAYEEALLQCRGLFDEAEKLGMHLTDLDIGGGFPIPSADGFHVDLEQMLESINYQIERLFPDTEVFCEPGRFICGTAVNLVASVVGTKMRGDSRWYILDEGIYGAFSGILFDHWAFPLHTFGTGEKMKSTFAGPSCDGIDVLYRDVMVSRMEIGDHVLVTNMGAYSTVSATRFNGFGIAPMHIFEEQFQGQSKSGKQAKAV